MIFLAKSRKLNHLLVMRDHSLQSELREKTHNFLVDGLFPTIERVT